MGSEIEAEKVKNAHAEEWLKIINTHQENERMLQIKELAERNGYLLEQRKLENYSEEARMTHQRELRKIEYEAENKRYLAETERLKNEAENKIKLQEIQKEHETKLKEIAAKEEKDRNEKERK